MIQRRKPLKRSTKPISRGTKRIRRSNPDRKPALWCEAFGAPAAKGSVQKKVVKRKAGVRQVSDKTRSRRDEYNREVKKWKALPENLICEFTGCQSPTRDNHHSRGKVGHLLMDKRFWRHLCREHHNWVGENMAEARTMGLLCETGKWNTPEPPDVLHAPESQADLLEATRGADALEADERGIHDKPRNGR
jgi:hypothetical protein